jgi:hypothetical protein
MSDLTLKMFVVKNELPRLNKAEERFYLFVKKTDYPITEQKIISYWSENVTSQRNPKMARIASWKDENDVWQYGWEDWTETEIKSYALNWFDKYLGRFIRLNYLMQLNILKKINEKD